eukprot:2547453-Rhodomonas_salina.2
MAAGASATSNPSTFTPARAGPRNSTFPAGSASTLCVQFSMLSVSDASEVRQRSRLDARAWDGLVAV